MVLSHLGFVCVSAALFMQAQAQFGAPLSTQNVLSRLIIPIQKIKVLKIMEDGILQPTNTL